MSTLTRILTHPGIGLLFRLVLAWVFLLAAWPKITCPDAFSVSVAAYRIGPDGLINLAAVTLPWVELFAGLGLLIGWRLRSFALLHIGLELFFMTLLVVAISQGVTAESCGCDVPGFTEEFGWGTVGRDLGFLLLAVYVALFDRVGWSADGWLARRAS